MRSDEITAEEPASEAGADFDDFYRSQHLRLYRSLLLVTGSREEAEDVANEAFTRVFERWDRVGAMGAPGAYLYRVALNLHRNALRRAWRSARRAVVERGVAEDFAPSVNDRADVLSALGALPRTQREAVVLVDLVGMTSAEAAQALRIDAQAVRARVSRGRARVREELSEDG